MEVMFIIRILGLILLIYLLLISLLELGLAEQKINLLFESIKIELQKIYICF